LCTNKIIIIILIIIIIIHVLALSIQCGLSKIAYYATEHTPSHLAIGQDILFDCNKFIANKRNIYFRRFIYTIYYMLENNEISPLVA